MGIIRKGILGGFKNKVGAVVGSSWRNRDVIKSLPRVSNKPPTQKQVEQRTKFGLVTSFLSSMTEFIEEGFKSKNGSTSAMNEAVAYHLKNAVTGVAPNFLMDYTKIKFSNGKLRVPSISTVDTAAPASVDFNWSLDGADSKYKDATDMINLLAFNPTKKQFVQLMAAAPRSALTFSLPLPLDFVGDSVHCFFSFSSVKKKKLTSDSVYIGLLPVA
ncbi:DUF6266 family protein [Pedobacter nyackensis]|uniref:DUF6266 family protein n=1 Tax=Pedobacter nyackensis TaxID=475255 RepID=UPI00292EE35E|nr:DUF6266 family protein [Pedobacter nyackensis]